MIGRIRSARLGIFLNVGIGIVFIIAAVIVVITVNYSMRQQALIEAQSKARIILDRNLATHTYFSQIMKPSIFAWSEPFRSKEYFDHTWMSSTYAIREIEKYFKSIIPSRYSFKDAAIDARSPENEADEYERAFIEKLTIDKKLESESTVRNIGGEPYLVVLRKGEVMEASCLKCHSNPKDAPKGLTDYYGLERSFNRKTGDTVSAVSLRIPLSEAYAAANIFSLKLSAILIVVLACLFAIQYWLYRRYLLEPLNVMREKANEIATHEGHLGEQIPQPFGRELSELTATFNEMSVKLRHDRDHLEELVDQRTEALQASEEHYRTLFNEILDGICLADAETGIIIDCNQALAVLVCRERAELIGQPQMILHPPQDDKKAFSLTFKQHLTDKQGQILETQVVTKTCDIREVEIKANFVVLHGKKMLQGLFHDITERKRAEEKLKDTLESLRKAVGTTIQVMASAVEARDPYTAGHQTRSADLARAIATEMGLSPEKIEGIRMAGSIHDIGKLSIPAEILSKPTKLSEIEFRLIKEHSRKGYEILKNVESPWPLAEIVYQHHERMDDSGYPRNLKGDDILIEARILAVADVVEAMASQRPYRPGLGIDLALAEIEKNRGTLYDEAVVDACLRLFREKRYRLAEA